MPPRRASSGTSSKRKPRVSYKESDDDSSIDDAAPRTATKRGKRPRASAKEEDSDAYVFSAGEHDEEADSGNFSSSGDALEEEEDYADVSTRKRARTSGSAGTKKPQRGRASTNGTKTGQTVVKLARAPVKPPPKTQISETMLSFLAELQDEQKNSRDWFAMHKELYQYSWDNLNAFITELLPRLMEVDDTMPWLPARDLTYRIYRDTRFSQNQAPYKTNLCATFSRGGRKGEFAGYHLQFEPGNRSFVAGGRWQPNKHHLATMRKHFLDDTELGQKLKHVIATPEFETYFGKAVPPDSQTSKSKAKKSKSDKTKDTIVTTRQSHADMARNIFGFEDELKVAPKIEGIENVREHKDIAWLRLRSFLVKRNFTDEEVTDANFMDQVIDTMRVLQPFIEVLNDMVYPPPTPPPSDISQDNDESFLQDGQAFEEDGE